MTRFGASGQAARRCNIIGEKILQDNLTYVFPFLKIVVPLLSSSEVAFLFVVSAIVNQALGNRSESSAQSALQAPAKGV